LHLFHSCLETKANLLHINQCPLTASWWFWKKYTVINRWCHIFAWTI